MEKALEQINNKIWEYEMCDSYNRNQIFNIKALKAERARIIAKEREGNSND